MLVRYVCKTCANEIMKLIDDPKNLVGVIPCQECAGFLERVISGPSSNSVQTIDNGFMTKSVEFDENSNKIREKEADEFYRKLTTKEELK